MQQQGSSSNANMDSKVSTRGSAAPPLVGITDLRRLIGRQPWHRNPLLLPEAGQLAGGPHHAEGGDGCCRR